MKIETTLGTVIGLGVIVFISGEVYGYMKCKANGKKN